MIVTTDNLKKANDLVQDLFKTTQGPQEALLVLLLTHLALFKGVNWPTSPDMDLMLAEYNDAFRELHTRFADSIEKAKPTILGPDGKPLQ